MLNITPYCSSNMLIFRVKDEFPCEVPDVEDLVSQ
jgi:hypothetical protein